MKPLGNESVPGRSSSARPASFRGWRERLQRAEHVDIADDTDDRILGVEHGSASTLCVSISSMIAPTSSSSSIEITCRDMTDPTLVPSAFLKNSATHSGVVGGRDRQGANIAIAENPDHFTSTADHGKVPNLQLLERYSCLVIATA